MSTIRYAVEYVTEGKKMQHSVILNAYISRLTLGDLDNLLKQSRACTYAAMNLGNSSQIEAQAGLYAAVCTAVDNLIRHDQEIISKIVNESVRGEQ